MIGKRGETFKLNRCNMFPVNFQVFARQGKDFTDIESNDAIRCPDSFYKIQNCS